MAANSFGELIHELQYILVILVKQLHTYIMQYNMMQSIINQ